MKRSVRSGTWFMEFVIVATLLAGIAGVLMPFHVHNEREDARQRTVHNLQKIRSQIGQYSADHQGCMPVNLANLTCEADTDGNSIRGDARPTGQPQIHPYLKTLPENAFSEAISGCRNQVRLIESDPPEAMHVTPGNLGGWLYNPQKGGVWIDHQEYFQL